jgi:hypothetical protein
MSIYALLQAKVEAYSTLKKNEKEKKKIEIHCETSTILSNKKALKKNSNFAKTKKLNFTGIPFLGTSLLMHQHCMTQQKVDSCTNTV